MHLDQLLTLATDLRTNSRNVLLDILTRNSGTEFGRRYRFDAITDSEAFKRAVPLTTYDFYREDLSRIRKGERGILSANPVLGLTRTSGTTGAAKVFPRSSLMDMELVDGVRAMLLGSPSPRGKRLAIIRAAKVDEHGLPVGGLAEVFYRFSQRAAPALMNELVSPPELYEADISYRDALYMHLLFTLHARDLVAMTFPFASGAADLFTLISSRRECLLHDVATGSFSEVQGISEQLKRSLAERLRPAPGRAKEIELALQGGIPGAARRIWPELRLLNTIVGGTFSAHLPELEEWLGPIPIYGMLYASSEATMGISVQMNSPCYALLPHSVYFEFIPVEADAGEGTVEAADLKEGSAYQVVITTADGLYRYQLGDIIKVVSRWKGLPLVTIEGRANEAKIFEYSIAEHFIASAVRAALGQRLVSFCVSPSTGIVPPCYVFRIETSNDVSSDPHSIAQVVDDFLMSADEVYRMSRASGRLGQARVCTLKPGAFARLRLEVFGQDSELNFQAKLPVAIVRKEWLGVLDAAPIFPA